MLYLVRVRLDRILSRSDSWLNQIISRRPPWISWLPQLNIKLTQLNWFYLSWQFHLCPLVLNDNRIILFGRASHAKVFLSDRCYRSMGWSLSPSLLCNLGGRETGEHLHYPRGLVAFLKDFNQESIHIVFWLLASHYNWLLVPFFKGLDLHLSLVVLICWNSFLIHKMVPASLDSDEAVDHIT